MNIEDLELPAKAKNLIHKRGIESLYPPQAEAVKRGLLDGENIVLAIPTASGKTLVAELAMLKGILSRKGKAIYLVPLKALASEKFEEFSEYEEIGIKVIQSTGDFDSEDYKLAKYDLIICTNEKIDSLLRHNIDWVKNVEIIVADEVHLIDDSHRGPTLEVVLARLKKTLPSTQILALSATISNADEIADWLDAELIQSEWRPVKLAEGVYFEGLVEFNSGKELRIPLVDKKNPEVDLVYDTIKNGGQALVFASTRSSSQAAADRVGQAVSRLLTAEEKEQLKQISHQLLTTGEKTSISERLVKVIQKGVSFHHAGLKPDQRKLIEENFKKNLIKCVCATPTLAAGVNLPARRVVIMSLTRYEVGIGNQPIKVLEYKQQAGRAGRPKYDQEGESIILAKKSRDRTRFMEEYCFGETEMIWSKLANESALRTHILAAISIGYVKDLKELAQFIKETFYGYQNDIATTEFQVKKILKFLKDERMIDNDGAKLWSMDFGRRVSQLYIDPLSAVIIRDGLKKAETFDLPISEISYFQLIATTPDLRNLYLRQKDQTEIRRFLWDFTDDFLTETPEEWEPDFEYFLMGVKTAILLSNWIDEKPEDAIITRFSIGSGDILYLTDNAKWLLYSAIEIAKLFNLSNVTKPLRELHIRVTHGIKKELLPLVKLRGIGRVRARLLYNHGYKSIASLRKAEPRELAKIPTIGPEIVRSIKEQVEDPVKDIELEIS
ncbi:MAG TPA: ATP-dependent DNA helicase [candidate division Zixibacteria bacterium]|nr:ATP-dependent DNA helicase [candidate division Zixibacteria bacterium]